MPHSILFVCLGNICRSPMAEGAMRAISEKQKVEIIVDSAGTGSWHVSSPPDGRARAAALAKGVDISRQKARQFSVQDFDRFDQIVAMDRSVFSDLHALKPKKARAELSLFLDHVAGREGEDVIDPYSGEDDGFARAWDDVTAGGQALLDRLIRG